MTNNLLMHTTLIILFTTHLAHTMEQTNSKKVKFMNIQFLWQTLDAATNEDAEQHVTTSPLPHNDFVQAILSKLEEKGYPAVFQNSSDKPYLKRIRAYCTSPEDQRAFIQQEFNEIEDKHKMQFRSSCLTYFKLIDGKS